MSRVQQHGSRKYGASAVGHVPPDRSFGEGSPQRIEPLPESRFAGNHNGNSRLNIVGVGQAVSASGSPEGKSAWVPVASVVGTGAFQMNTSNPNHEPVVTTIDGSRGKVSMSRREVRPKQYWEAPVPAQQSERSVGRPPRKGYLSDESNRRRGCCNWVCCLWLSLALLALVGLAFGLWKAFGNQKKVGVVATQGQATQPSTTPATGTPIESSQAPTSTATQTAAVTSNTAEATIDTKPINPSDNSTQQSYSSNTTTTTTTSLTEVQNISTNTTANGSSDVKIPQPATAPGPIVDTNVCSPTFFRWNGRCIHCPDDSPWNGTNCVHPPPEPKLIRFNESSTVTAGAAQLLNQFEDLSKHKDFTEGSVSDSPNSASNPSGGLSQTFLNPNNVTILNHWRKPRHLRQ